LNFFYTISFSHHRLSVTDVGCLHISEDSQEVRLSLLKQHFHFSELLYLSTCNRVEFLISSTRKIDRIFVSDFLSFLYPEISPDRISFFSSLADVFDGLSSVRHILRVASSIESMVVGEREIITQVRKAYDLCKANGLTGDFIRLLIRHTIETTKQIYTNTDISKRPVSIVSLAYHELQSLGVSLDSRILIVGAGSTNTNLSRFLKKHHFSNFVVFNRTLSKAEQLADTLSKRSFSLEKLATFNEGFDILIVCTGSEQHLISPSLYANLLAGESGKKIVIDLSIPQDLAPEIVELYPVVHISMDFLQHLSTKNLQERNKEVVRVEQIIEEKIIEFEQLYKWRSIERALQNIPHQVRQIKTQAFEEIYRQEIDSLDSESKAILDKVIAYMERKYMNMPMVLAKDAFFSE